VGEVARREIPSMRTLALGQGFETLKIK